MKTRENFEKIRNQRKRFSLRVRLILLVSAEILVSVLLGYLFDMILKNILPNHIELPPLIVLIVFSLLVGGIVTAFMSKLFFDPIKELGKGMEKVADGDFSVQLETNSSAQEIREIYSGFNLMTHELRATEVLQTDFVSNVSHEFKTPINAIEGYATLLQGFEGMTKEEQTECIDKILFNTKRLSELVGNILLLSKTENQAIDANRKNYRLDEQIRQAILMYEAEWTKKDIEFDVELEDTEYFGNEKLLHHVWYNLIGNAIKFSPCNGLVRIVLRNEQGSVVFEIYDKGPGLSEQAQKHMFDKFYQGDSSHKQEGNGLGLALVKKILDACGGTVGAENLPDGGCRFRVVLKA